MPHASNRPAIIQINQTNLQHNYAVLNKQSGSAEVMAVVKANAYGHGLKIVATSLHEIGCRNFAVTDAREGIALRQALGDSNAININLLSGLFHANDALLASTANLTPVITEHRHLDWLQAASFHGHVWIKIDSGLHRLGAAYPAALIAQCQQADISVCGLMSHLACADEAKHPMNHQQVETFTRLCEQVATALPRSMLNSAGIAAMPEHSMDMVRPGIALYGMEPISSLNLGLKPVMTLLGGIMQIRDVPAGAAVSYSASFIAPHRMRIATVSLGYADGLPRDLSNIGAVFLNANICPIIGRVCMDYSMIDISHTDAVVGDQAEFWGEHILATDVATQLDTISYTLFTGIGTRVQRRKGT
ncbi:MAG: alanine racemase [Mariprofundus sp.]|nr:alanine racemase [Mariprofundus sp.]